MSKLRDKLDKEFWEAWEKIAQRAGVHQLPDDDANDQNWQQFWSDYLDVCRENFERTGNSMFAMRAFKISTACFGEPKPPPEWVQMWLGEAFFRWEDAEGKEPVGKYLGLNRRAYKGFKKYGEIEELKLVVDFVQEWSGLSIEQIVNHEPSGEFNLKMVKILSDLLEKVTGLELDTVSDYYRRRGKKTRGPIM